MSRLSSTYLRRSGSKHCDAVPSAIASADASSSCQSFSHKPSHNPAGQFRLIRISKPLASIHPTVVESSLLNRKVSVNKRLLICRQRMNKTTASSWIRTSHRHGLRCRPAANRCRKEMDVFRLRVFFRFWSLRL